MPPTNLKTGQRVTVGVLDTCIAAHPWLEGGWTAPRDQTILPRRSGPYRPQQGHATFVTGLILRQAPGATVRVRPVLNEAAVANSWDVAKAIVEFGRTGGLDIMNLPFVCYTEDGQPPLATSTAIDRLDPNIVVVAAAGNHGKDPSNFDRRRPAWPAALDRVVAVGATDGKRIADFTPVD